MEILGGILLSLALMVVLAALGLVTVIGVSLMIVLGLLTDLSFKRLFFLSFGLGLFAPLLLAGATIAAIEDGSLERELRNELGDIVQLPEDRGGDWRGTLEELQKIGRERDRGQLTDEEAEARLRRLFSGDNGVPLRLEKGEDGVTIEGVEIIEGDGTVRIEID